MLTSERMTEPQTGREIVRTLLHQAPDNPLVLTELALQIGYAPNEIAQAISRNAARYPDSYLCLGAGFHMMRTIGNIAMERRAIERAVKCDPGNSKRVARSCQSKFQHRRPYPLWTDGKCPEQPGMEHAEYPVCRMACCGPQSHAG